MARRRISLLSVGRKKKGVTRAPCFDDDLIYNLLNLSGMEGLGHEVGLDNGHDIVDGLVSNCDANGDGLAID